MNKEIRDIIKKNLPGEVGIVLKQQLQEAESDRKDLAVALSDVETAKEKSAYLSEENKRLKAELQSFKSLEAWEAELSKREGALAVTLLENRLADAETTNQHIIGFVNALMRNTTFRESHFADKQQQYDQNGNYISVPTGDFTREEKAE